jgi:dTDP-4-amino-4,6-dideoxygalactose transaminase
MDFHAKFTVPMSAPDLTEAERQAVLDVVNTPQLSMGPQVLAFEAAFREYIGCQYALAVNSGTAGLHLCMIAAGVKTDSLVITTPFSFVASTNVILYEHGIPVFVDVDPASGNIDPELAQQAAQDLAQGGESARRWLPRKGADNPGPLQALLAVDVFGQPADYHRLRETASRFSLGLIEDSCEALGAEYHGQKAGSLADAGIFAFYPNKQITTAEGGMVVTDDEHIARVVLSLRNQGRAPGDTWLQHTNLGYNYRLDEMSAALGVVQMGRLEALLAARDRVAGWYSERLAELPGLETPESTLTPATTRPSWFVYVVRLPEGMDRDQTIERLARMGIPARPYFSPIHLQPYMVERFSYRAGDFPVTEALGRRGLALPFSGTMTESQVEQVCQALAGAMRS